MLRSLLVLALCACESSEAHQPAPAEGKPTATAAETKPPVAAREASRAALRLAEYKTGEHLVTARATPLGEPLRIYDFDVVIEQPILALPETRLPWIANSDERAVFRGKHALILPIKSRNDAPVARELLVGFTVHTRDGKSHGGGVYNERLAAKQLGRVAWYDLEKQAPDQWVETVLVFEVDPAQLDGAVLYAARWKTVKDRWGRSRQVVDQHVVADLPKPVEGPPIRGK